MSNSRLMIATALMLAASAMGQTPATAPESDSAAAQPETVPKLPSGSPQRAEKLPERFVPTDKISPDNVISFPTDI